MYAAAMSPAAVQSERYVEPAANDSARTYAIFQHLVGLASAMDGMGFLGLIGALIMWRVRTKDSPFLDDHGREAVNFQISLLLYVLVGTIPTLGVVVIAAFVLRLVGCIRGAMAASRGEYYRYPMCIRFIKGPADA